MMKDTEIILLRKLEDTIRKMPFGEHPALPWWKKTHGKTN
jgi:hypothetical protein